MCGVAAIFNFNGSAVNKAQAEKIGKSLAHRGQDDAGLLIEGDYALIHRRLSIIDLSKAAKQPFVDCEGRAAISFNGEIVNYIELKSELEKFGHKFSTRSDTEVLIKGYLHFGLEFVKRLRGFFAFVIIDFGNRRIVAARDIFGIKPLYFYRDRNHIIFASEVKAIVSSGVVQTQIDAEGLQDYLFFQSYTEDRTLFRGIKSIRPATLLTIDMDSKELSQSTYWHHPNVENNIDYDEWIEEIEFKFINAIKLWTRADVDVGSYLSGGLDSSLVSAFSSKQIRESKRNTLITFSSIFDSQRTKDEREFSDAASLEIGSEHHKVMLSIDEICQDQESLMYCLDMPVAGYSAPYRTLARYARRHVKVVLTGHGGDELCGGYPKYLAATLISEINKSLRSGADINVGRWLPYLHGFEAQAKNILSAGFFRSEAELINAVFSRSGFLWDYVRPEIKLCRRGYSSIESVALRMNNFSDDPFRSALRLDQELLLPALLHVEDRTSMSENLESRTPLLDQDFAEALGRAPSEFLLRDGLKSPLRQLGRKYLPEKILLNKQKTGVVFPIYEYRDRELREQMIRDMDFLDSTGLFIMSSKEMLLRHNRGEDFRSIWALWSLGGWLRAFNPII